MTRVKICGLTNLADAELAAELGADALGFVFEPTSPRCIQDISMAAEIARQLGPYVTCVAVFGEVIQLDLRFDAVQYVQGDPSYYPHSKPIPCIRPRPGETALEVLKTMNQNLSASAFVLDAYDPEKWGGAGRTLDWELSAEIVANSKKPIILAGGLTPENVAEAIRKVHPHAVDVSSGVEKSPGLKDPAMLKDFILTAKIPT